MAKLKIEPKTKTEERELECLLTADEITERAQTLAHSVQDKTEILLEKKEVMSGFKERIDACDLIIINSSNAINTGKEKRVIECEIELNTPKDGTKTIIRKDTGEAWQEEMTNAELQEEIF